MIGLVAASAAALVLAAPSGAAPAFEAQPSAVGGGGGNGGAKERRECKGSGTLTYRGRIKQDPESRVAVRVKCKRGERQIRRVRFRDMHIRCDVGEARLSSATINGPIRVNRRGEFGVTGRDGEQRLRVAGKLFGERNATGRVRYSGPTEVDDATLPCYSGKERWSASR